MSLLYYWRGDNYRRDVDSIRPGDDLDLAQNSPLFRDVAPDEQIWAFTRLEDGRYVLAASYRSTLSQPTTSGYGAYRVRASPGSTTMYDLAGGADIEPIIRRLSVPARAKILGHSFQGTSAVRRLSGRDDSAIATFAVRQPIWYTTATGRKASQA